MTCPSCTGQRKCTLLKLPSTASTNGFLSFCGPAPVPETWDPLRGPKVDTKQRQKFGHPLWVPTFFVVNWGPFLGSWSWVPDFHLFSLSFQGKTNPQRSKRLTGCTSHSTRERHPSANDTDCSEEHPHKQFPHEGWLPRDYTKAMFVDDYHRDCIPIRRI